MDIIKIDLKEDQNIWFTSDLHLLHKNISGKERSEWKNGYRDFKDEYQMTDILIENINNIVKYDDILFNLGDFVFKNHKRIPEIRGRIICQNIYHILGNHDNHILEHKDQFTSVNSLVRLDLKKQEKMYCFVLCHYAMRVWFHNNREVYHLYGHSHNNLEKTEYGKSMDVGVDAAKAKLGDCQPFSLEEILKILDKRDILAIDHHK